MFDWRESSREEACCVTCWRRCLSSRTTFWYTRRVMSAKISPNMRQCPLRELGATTECKLQPTNWSARQSLALPPETPPSPLLRLGGGRTQRVLCNPGTEMTPKLIEVGVQRVVCRGSRTKNAPVRNSYAEQAGVEAAVETVDAFPLDDVDHSFINRLRKRTAREQRHVCMFSKTHLVLLLRFDRRTRRKEDEWTICAFTTLAQLCNCVLSWYHSLCRRHGDNAASSTSERVNDRVAHG